jgi:peroxin-12
MSEGIHRIRLTRQYFTHRYPRYLLRVLNNHEEFFACLLLLLERHHLKRHSECDMSRRFCCMGCRVVPNMPVQPTAVMCR